MAQRLLEIVHLSKVCQGLVSHCSICRRANKDFTGTLILLQFPTNDMAISRLSTIKISICSNRQKAFIFLLSSPVLVHESLAFLYTLSTLFHLSLHLVPVFTAEKDAFISSLALLNSTAISCHFGSCCFFSINSCVPCRGQ